LGGAFFLGQRVQTGKDVIALLFAPLYLCKSAVFITLSAFKGERVQGFLFWV
jgi:hypothetical protein